MTAPARAIRLADPLAVLIARAQARATLVLSGDMELHEAVDGLQDAAAEYGLVDALGQDAVQAIMAQAFATLPFTVEACDAEDEPEPDETSRRREVATSTIDAAEYLVREGDPARLRKWLDVHSAEERSAIRKHLEAKRCSRPSR